MRWNNMVQVSEGNFTRASPAEAAAARAAAGPGGRPYLGCFSGDGLLMAGAVVGVVDGVGDADACCHACREDATCNVWAWCPEPAGCK